MPYCLPLHSVNRSGIVFLLSPRKSKTKEPCDDLPGDWVANHELGNDGTIKKVVGNLSENPHLYLGKRINVNRKDKGDPYPTFTRPRYTKDYTFRDFCLEAAKELIIVAGLVEEE